MGSCTYINRAPKAHISAMVTSCLVLHLFVFSKWICCDCSDIRSPASFIRTLTVGTGISPVQPACEPTHARVADSSARPQASRLRHGAPLTPPDLPPVGIPPRPETALASVARAGFHASMPRVIYGGGNALEMQPGQSSATITYPPIPKCCAFRGKAAKQQKGKATATTTFPIHPKVARLSRKARNSEGDTYPYRSRPSPPADLKAVNAGNPGA